MNTIIKIASVFLFVLVCYSCEDKQVLPLVTTSDISEITRFTAISGGDISNIGASEIIERGVCWSNIVLPTILNDKTVDSTGPGSFTSKITELNPNTIYQIRAYASNSLGTSYGETKTFTTILQEAPVVTTNGITLITASSCRSGGYIKDYGGAAEVSYGVCWSKNHNPTTSDNTNIPIIKMTGHFYNDIGGLVPSTTYYLRAFATNSVGTGYGDEVSFTTITGIGESFQGGIIAYIFQSGDPGYIAGQTHGLIAAPADQSTGITWSFGSGIITWATGTALGSGNANTNLIVNTQGSGNYAARVCSDLILNGYDDWYLPSKSELDKLYTARIAIGGFTWDYYWSSTEINSTFAYSTSFKSDLIKGILMDSGKANLFRVRAVRNF
jgi:hypothetical protein